MPRPLFAAIGLEHDHVFAMADCLIAAGAELAAFHGATDGFGPDFARRHPGARPVDDPRAILEDPAIALVISAAVPCRRAGIAVAAMRHGKDVLLDKPGMTTLDQLSEVRRVSDETGRMTLVLFSEHHLSRASVRAGELVAAGAIGRVVHLTGLGPHRLRAATRPDWFFRRAATGGILTDIASHQCEQFLAFTGAAESRLLSAHVANRAHPEHPELQDTGTIHVAADTATATLAVDWFTPDGLPVWGDGRLFLTGTEGTIEVRKHVDPAGRAGGDHLLIADRSGVRHIDCRDVPLPFGTRLLADIAGRTETAMPCARSLAAMALALRAQALAEAASP